MPELPEVETTVRGLARIMTGQQITQVSVRRPDLRHPFPPDLAPRLAGAVITSLGRRAKYGLIHTDRDDTMIFHLGMSGRWRINPDTIEKHDHLVIDLANNARIALHDARRFGFVDLEKTSRLDRYPPFVKLGPEPLGNELSGAYLAAAFKGRKTAIKQALLDQHIIAGLGNIYVCEALYSARIAPTQAAGSLSDKALHRLTIAIRDVLQAAIAAGGSTIRDYAQPSGELGYFANSWQVYGREGELCPRGHTIQRIIQGGRSTFWCPSCQKET